VNMKKQTAMSEFNNSTIQYLVHDLEPALASFQSITGLLGKGRFDPNNPLHQRLVVSCEHALEFSRTILHDMLEYGRLQADGFALELSELDLGQSLPEMVAIAEIQAREKNIRLQVEVAPGLPPVTTDPKIMGRIVSNLTINSVKYAPPDSQVWVRLLNEKSGAAAITIEDEGPGVEAQLLERIFSGHFQAAPQQPGAYRGVGLGLAYCWEAMRHLGGKIEARNRKPTGLQILVTGFGQ